MLCLQHKLPPRPHCAHGCPTFTPNPLVKPTPKGHWLHALRDYTQRVSGVSIAREGIDLREPCIQMVPMLLGAARSLKPKGGCLSHLHSRWPVAIHVILILVTNWRRKGARGLINSAMRALYQACWESLSLIYMQMGVWAPHTPTVEGCHSSPYRGLQRHFGLWQLRTKDQNCQTKKAFIRHSLRITSLGPVPQTPAQ